MNLEKQISELLHLDRKNYNKDESKTEKILLQVYQKGIIEGVKKHRKTINIINNKK